MPEIARIYPNGRMVHHTITANLVLCMKGIKESQPDIGVFVDGECVQQGKLPDATVSALYKEYRQHGTLDRWVPIEKPVDTLRPAAASHPNATELPPKKPRRTKAVKASGPNVTAPYRHTND